MGTNLKQQVQQFLRWLGLYHRFKTSRLYDLYWTVVDRSVIQRRADELEFYRRSLAGFRMGDLIFDVGANQGFKTDIFLRLGARVIAVEPDELNQEILRQNFAFLRLRKKPVAIVAMAVSDQMGIEAMWVNEAGSAKNTLNVKWVETLKIDSSRFGEHLNFAVKRDVGVTTMEELFRTHGLPFYVKIDVEGYEAKVLKGMQTPVPFLSFEVNLPEFRPEALHCIAMLDAIDPNAEWSYAAECTRETIHNRWVERDEIIRLLNDCNLPSIEVFWKSPAGLARLRGSASS